MKFQVVIEAIRGSDYKGDISIDDIDIINGLCPPPGKKKFSAFKKYFFMRI